MKPSAAIRCPSCGKDALLIREPIYEGFTKIGEELRCSSCGRRFASEDSAAPVPVGETPAIFDASDRSETPRIFSEDEKGRLCRYCAHYVVNPFVQRCALWGREVEATDSCERFEARERDETVERED